MSEKILEVQHLKKYFETKRGMLHAVDDVNFSINKGETLGVVGESGCGKSTLGRVIVNLLNKTSGKVIYKGQDITELNKHEFKKIRREIQLIFQDPYGSLNPRNSVSTLIGEPIKVSGTREERKNINNKVRELMQTVGLADRFINSFPHELDGGRRQRIGVARSLALDPEFIVCDEPVSALDVSIQAQILNLLMDLQDERKLSYIFITHDLSVVKHISDKIAVMYLGQCVELAEKKELFAHPLHPYTVALFKSIPRLNPRSREDFEIIKGEVVSPIEPKPGCRFAARCKYATSDCVGHNIPLVEVSTNHFVACTNYRK